MITSRTTFTGETVELDGRSFVECRFVGCRIVYRGEAETSLQHNEFEDCAFALEGPASLTMGFLKGLATSSDGFLVTFLRALDLEPERLSRLSAASTRPL